MEYEWDLEKLTLDDVILLTGGVNPRAAFEILARCARGGAASIPALRIREAFEDFMKRYAEAMDPKGTADL